VCIVHTITVHCKINLCTFCVQISESPVSDDVDDDTVSFNAHMIFCKSWPLNCLDAHACSYNLGAPGLVPTTYSPIVWHCTMATRDLTADVQCNMPKP